MFISACITFIPIGKYQNEFLNFVRSFRNKPQEHFDKQVEYANYIEQHGELPPILTQPKPTKIEADKQVKEQNPQKRKPKYIRDKKNPKILHPYKERKFLFLRFY